MRVVISISITPLYRHNTLVDGKVQDTILRDANTTYSAYQYAKQAVQVSVTVVTMVTIVTMVTMVTS